MNSVYIVDYGSGNLLSLANAVKKLGYTVNWATTTKDIVDATCLILPGVGHYGYCCAELRRRGLEDAIRDHINANKPFLGICVGLQYLMEGSAEDSTASGLNIIPARLEKFSSHDKPVPHMGWNSVHYYTSASSSWLGVQANDSRLGDIQYYFVHSYALCFDDPTTQQRLLEAGWSVALTVYGDELFVSALRKGNVFATQFHPEKSGQCGLDLLKNFLGSTLVTGPTLPRDKLPESLPMQASLQKWANSLRPNMPSCRIMVCLDVRSDDHGNLVVTKGDQYDVRERNENATVGSINGQVRNMGSPIDMAERYYNQGADEIVFLSITSFRNCPAQDLPMLNILRSISKTVFVPLTIGGGITDTLDSNGQSIRAVEVASLYFKNGADKVSIGSDAVYAAERYYGELGEKLDGSSSIEQISRQYGKQAVVVSVDPRRVYQTSIDDQKEHSVIRTKIPGKSGESYCWYQCTVKGGRENRNIDVIQLIRAVEIMGAGEILLNSIDRDGSSMGFDTELIEWVKRSTKLPVIASSGAGNPDHFRKVFQQACPDAALGAGMFHSGKFTIRDVKTELLKAGLKVADHD